MALRAFVASAEATTKNRLVFQAAPEGLDIGVVVAVGLAARGGNQTVSSQLLAIGAASKLGATIRVDDQRDPISAFAQCNVQSGKDELLA